MHVKKFHQYEEKQFLGYTEIFTIGFYIIAKKRPKFSGGLRPHYYFYTLILSLCKKKINPPKDKILVPSLLEEELTRTTDKVFKLLEDGRPYESYLDDLKRYIEKVEKDYHYTVKTFSMP